MEVILLERVPRLGQMGEVVRVKDGFARNFLLPRGKALRATTENRTRFESMKSEPQARSLALKSEAGQVAEKLDGKTFTVLRRLRKQVSCSDRFRRATSSALLQTPAIT